MDIGMTPDPNSVDLEIFGPLLGQQTNGQYETYHPSDHGNALRLINTHGTEFRRVADMRRHALGHGPRGPSSPRGPHGN
jgi:hypothetical protein